MAIRFLNVDLEIESSHELKVFIDDLGEDILLLHSGQGRRGFFVSFELADGAGDADSTICGLCRLIETLSPKGKELWDSAYSRVFDVGFECTTSPARFTSDLKQETVNRVAKLGGSIQFTVYPGSGTEQGVP